MKQADIRSETGKAYFRFWSVALKGLLGWPDQRIEQWADRFSEYIHNEHDALYHSLPGTYIVAEYLNERCPGWQKKLEKQNLWTANTMREISDCLNEFIYPELEKGQGWEQARSRLDEVLKRFDLL